ncbi:MAG: carboxypeptidase-like regulatory domain-containing protein [Actinomycetota bacterium]
MKHTLVAWSLFAAALLAGCAGSPGPGSGDAGVQGVVRVGPACPVQREGTSCPDRPLATELRFVQGSDVAATVRTGDDGRFRVGLAPGSYTIRSGKAGLPTLRPVQVTVPPHAYTTVTLTFDSGIR